MASTGIFELSAITGGTGALRSDDVLCVVDVHDTAQAAQGSLVKITLAQLYRTETTAVTVSTPLPDVAQTWNNAAVTFTAVKVNVTSTASAVGSLLLDLQVAASSKFSVRKDGLITGAAGATITGTVAATTFSGSGASLTAVPASVLTGTTLASNVVTTSITTVGVLASPHVTTLTVDSGGITVTSGTTAVQALSGTNLTASGWVQIGLQVGSAGSIGGTAAVGVAHLGRTGSLYDWAVYDSTAANHILAVTPGTRNLVTGGTLTVASGLTVSAGTSALQALTATTGVFAGAVSGITTLAIGGTLSGVTTLTCTTVTATNLGGTLSTAAQASVTSVGTLTSLTTSGTITMTATVSKIVPGATSWGVRNNADAADNLIITDAGAVTFRSTVGGITTLSCTTVTATNLGGTLSTAAQASVTSLGTLTALTVSGTVTMTAAASKLVPGATSFSHRNNADSADNLIITDAGVVTIRAGLTVTAGGITVSAGTTTLGVTVTNALTATALTLSAGAFQIIGGGTSTTFRNAADSANNVVITDAGAVTVRSTLTVTAGGLTVTAGGISIGSGLFTIAGPIASAAGTGTDIVLGATTQTTIGANGAASALTANPLGYLVFFKGTTKCILPYYNG